METTKHRRLLVAVGMLLALGFVAAAPAHAYTFGGRAYSAMVTVPLGGTTFLADTGALIASGGAQATALPSLSVPGVLAADVPVAAAVGATYDDGPQVNGSTSLADVVVFPGQAAQLSASFVRAQADVSATGVQGRSEIADLTFAGMSIAVTGDANQRVDVFGVGTLIINEQSVTSSPLGQAVTVNALHLILATGAEVILSSAGSTITW